jgi:hypothetical protein
MEVLAMKKLALAVLFVALVGSLALAQTGTITGNTSYVPTTDVMGAHENGGRGCAGCHSPHSGGRGSGGTITGSGASNPYGAGNMGDSGLWGTDTSAIQNAGTLTFYGSYTVNLSGLTWSSGGLYTGVATCLSCHDGNVSKGAMMTGLAYEQAWGLLNFASSSLRNAGPNGYLGGAGLNPYPSGNPITNPPVSTTPMLYGQQPIPTLLGNDGGTPGDYNNDHPIGPLANMGAVVGAYLSNLTVTFSGTNNTRVKVTANTGTGYYNFAWTYGLPALNKFVGDGSGIAGNAYVVCTTCHNQHVQNVVTGAPSGAPTGSPAANLSTGAVAKIFYVSAAYNPAAPYDPTHEPSTMRFCQECHYSMSSERYGATNIGTAY